MFGVSKTGYNVMCVRSVLLKQDGLHGVAGIRYPSILQEVESAKYFYVFYVNSIFASGLR